VPVPGIGRGCVFYVLLGGKGLWVPENVAKHKSEQHQAHNKRIIERLEGSQWIPGHPSSLEKYVYIST